MGTARSGGALRRGEGRRTVSPTDVATIRPGTSALAPAGALVLGSYLGRIRGQAGLSVKQTAETLGMSCAAVTEYELGTGTPLGERDLAALLKLYGRLDESRYAQALRQHAGEDELRSPTPLPPQCVEALEGRATHLTIFTTRPIPPTLYSPTLQTYQEQQVGTLLPAFRPRPDCPITLLLDVAVLFGSLAVPELFTDQLNWWVELAEAGDLEIRLVPQEVILPEGVQLVSEIALPQGRRVWIDEAFMPAFSTGSAGGWRANVISRARDEAYGAQESLTGIRDAARALTRARGPR
ncbi:helix-turn-helix domain-containing protein [Streptomyces sp. NPDC054854]